MITVKTREEIKILREGGRRLGRILAEVSSRAKPGVSALELDRLAESLIFSSGGAPSFKGYRIKETRSPFPASLCVSVNDEVVHAIPCEDKVLKEGDVVGLDIGMRWPASANASAGKPAGLFTDTAVTIGVGKISPEAKKLLRVTREALEIGIKAVRPGARVGDVSAAVQQHLEAHTFGVIRDLAGHGVGYKVHEEPLIPNYGEPGTGPELTEGMVIAIEPMATLGDWRLILAPDEWTFRTRDGSLAAHFEHSIVVTAEGAEVLTQP